MKYKLKKWYPLLHADLRENDIVIYNREHDIYFREGQRNEWATSVSVYEVENHPDFWEPVIKDMYSVKAFSCIDIANIATDIIATTGDAYTFWSEMNYRLTTHPNLNQDYEES